MKLAFQHCVSEVEAKEAFQVFDVERKGFIAPHELRLFLTTMGDALSQEEINAFMEDLSSEMDMDGNIIYSDAIYKMTPEMYR
ncbi:calmodulin-like protein [Angomonas deanei]|nr:calmodulin-like protein [Angomonas deanei]EPY40069.1 calmodulin-like protein [Angomonas deanei]|eukprot:EPY38513.1 calmodulin-like protein [Angomonas deanei]